MPTSTNSAYRCRLPVCTRLSTPGRALPQCGQPVQCRRRSRGGRRTRRNTTSDTQYSGFAEHAVVELVDVVLARQQRCAPGECRAPPARRASRRPPIEERQAPARPASAERHARRSPAAARGGAAPRARPEAAAAARGSAADARRSRRSPTALPAPPARRSSRPATRARGARPRDPSARCRGT